MAEHTAAERTVTESVAAERTAAERTAAERTAAERAATERTATERTATERTATERTMAERTATIAVMTRTIGGGEGIFSKEPQGLLRSEISLPDTWSAAGVAIEIERGTDGLSYARMYMYADRSGHVVTRPIWLTPEEADDTALCRLGVEAKVAETLSFDAADPEDVLGLAMVVVADLIETRLVKSGSRFHGNAEGLAIIKTVRAVLIDLATVIAENGIVFGDEAVDDRAHILCKVALAEAAGESVVSRIKDDARYPKSGIDSLEHVVEYVDLSAQSPPLPVPKRRRRM